MKNEVGRRHKFVRENILYISVAEYAERLTTTAAAVYAWESGRRSVPHSIIEYLATTYGISATWMLTGQGEAMSERTQPIIKNKLDTIGEIRYHIDAMHTLLTRLEAENTRRTDMYQYENVFSLPKLSGRVSAGTPVGVDDDFEQVNLMETLVNHREHMCIMNVVGDSMTEAGINDGDMLLVDTAAEPKNGQVVIAKVFGELTVKRFIRQGQTTILKAENPIFADIEITPHTEIEFIAVVRHCIKKF